MKRCNSPYRGNSLTTSARKHLSPQLWSCSLRPVRQLTSQLNTRLGQTLCQGSFLTRFQPLTTSNPSSSLARNFGISAGSSCRSASIWSTTCPSAASNPAASAAALPKLRRKRMPRIRGSAVANRRILSHEPSRLPSSTKITSRESPCVAATVSKAFLSSSRLSDSLRRGTTMLISSGLRSFDSIHDPQCHRSTRCRKTKDPSRWRRHSCLCLHTFRRMPEDQRFYQYKGG